MPNPLERLKLMSITPDRKDGAFEKWLQARDAVDFLEQNARETDFVLYASLQHVYFETVVVSLDRLTPPDMNDLMKWDQIRDLWGYDYNLSEPPVYISPPMANSVSATLRGAEPLVYQRSFDGFDSDKHYIEFLQKFGPVRLTRSGRTKAGRAGLSGQLSQVAIVQGRAQQSCNGSRRQPSSTGFGSEETKSRSTDHVTLKVEVVVDGCMGGKESLG